MAGAKLAWCASDGCGLNVEAKANGLTFKVVADAEGSSYTAWAFFDGGRGFPRPVMPPLWALRELSFDGRAAAVEACEEAFAESQAPWLGKGAIVNPHEEPTLNAETGSLFR